MIDDVKTSKVEITQPVEVKTTVTNLKTGLRFQSTADIIITETAKGALGAGDNNVIRVGIAEDGSSSFGSGHDVALDSSVRIKVVDGDLIITKQACRRGILRFEVASQSTTPSTLKMSNVAVIVNSDVDRDVEYPYKKIMVAISAYNKDECFVAEPITADYLRIE